MSTTSETRFILYASSALFSFGLLGNLITIYFFRIKRHHAIIFLLIVLSISNCITLIIGLLNRNIISIVSTDLSLMSPIWCKLRTYVAQSSVLFSQSCACLASVNCFLSTCRQVSWRRLVSLSITRQCVLIIVFFWLIHGLFNPFLTELIIINGRSPSCSLTNSMALNYTTFFLRPVLIGLFPLCTFSISGILTYQNLNQFCHRRQFIQKTLCRMLLFQMIVYVLSTIPYASFYTYQSITSSIRKKTSTERAQESVVSDFVNLIFYMPQASPFYVYYLSSKIFRKQVKDAFSCARHNRIQAVHPVK